MTLGPCRPRAVPPAPSCPATSPGGAPSARADRYAKTCLAGTDTDYLCLHCYDPLYVKDGTAEEECFNQACRAYVGRGEFSGDISSQGWAPHAKKLCAESVARFYKFGRSFLFRKLFEARAHECEKLFHDNAVSLNVIASVDYLLTCLDINAAWGSSTDISSLHRALDRYRENFDMFLMVEKFCTKYWIANPSGDLYIMKYHHALEKFSKTIGIVGVENRHDRAACYSYDFIDRQSKGNLTDNPFDFNAIYLASPTIISQLNHVFKTGHMVSEIHRYPSRSEDFAALLSVWTRCFPNPAIAIDREGLKLIYDGAAHKNKMVGDFDQFLMDYTSGREYAPILVFDGENYHLEYHAMLLYLLYLFSNNRTRSGTQTETGQAAYDRLRQAPARTFEEEIRQRLRSDGFEVHPAPGQAQLRMSFDNKKTEFDCVAVDRAKKILVLIEAKYEDIAPSSMAGTTIVDQMVLDRRRGLLSHAKKHHKHCRLFGQNFAALKNFGLDLPGSFHDYAVHTVIVTKHEPLISRHMGVDIISYEKFTSRSLRDRGEPSSCSAAPCNLPQAPEAQHDGAGEIGWPHSEAPGAAAGNGCARKGLPAPSTAKGENAGRPSRAGAERRRRGQ